MDLGTVKKKMMAKDKSGYKNAREMYEDVKLTFKNAITYNKKGTGVRVAAKTLLNKFEKKWQDLLPKVEKAVIFFSPKYVPFFSMNETVYVQILEAESSGDYFRRVYY
jgi:hypothetical protein